jgi:hypothetical protein
MLVMSAPQQTAPKIQTPSFLVFGNSMKMIAARKNRIPFSPRRVISLNRNVKRLFETA